MTQSDTLHPHLQTRKSYKACWLDPQVKKPNPSSSQKPIRNLLRPRLRLRLELVL